MKLPAYTKNWRDLIKPKRLELEMSPDNQNYGKFIAKPLERGFGLTLGNVLRRILLSSLQGAAIVGVEIDGVLHEFGTIPGVTEDVADIILNLKQVVLRMHTTEDQTISVDATGPKEVTAGDIITNDQIDILNPDAHVATLNKDGRLKMRIHVKMGRGYVPSERIRGDIEKPVGFIPVDAVFSPVRKVNYTVTNARIGQRTDYDRLTLEVWTNGSVKADDALAFAAKILKEQVQSFINFQEIEEVEEEESKPEEPQFNENLYRTVDELELSVRSANCLQNANIKFIGELVQKSEMEMLKTKNFGRKSLNEIKEVLSGMGLSLGMKVEGFDSAKAPKKQETA